MMQSSGFGMSRIAGFDDPILALIDCACDDLIMEAVSFKWAYARTCWIVLDKEKCDQLHICVSLITHFCLSFGTGKHSFKICVSP